MAVRSSSAEWKGTLKEGEGILRLGSGAWEGPFTFASRFESGPGTNPEELIGAAQAGCFSMFLSALLTKEGFVPDSIRTTAKVHLGEGPSITLIELSCEAQVPGITTERFAQLAGDAKNNCPVSKALAGPEITLAAALLP
ncbi:MAG TPA: OsmC family protein [bacterium]|nr:OsmC family protein [bacterium]HQG45082.1 OsmC family protein [bacterium]HQI49627.1 OsmC family protein [bacterium]HQJ66157.1 OsmC family protein [bacterium]